MQLHRARPEFEALGRRLVLIGQATPRQAAHFRRRLGIDLPVLADEDRGTYRAIGAKVATATELIGPKIVARGVVESRRSGVVQGRVIGHAAQLGGAAVIRPDGSVAWSHLSQDAGDNASPQEILDALRSA